MIDEPDTSEAPEASSNTPSDDTTGDETGAVGHPLNGTTVLITRAKHQAASLATPLEERGAEVLVAPVIETVDPADWGPVDDAISSLETYDWIVLTSTNAVDRFFARMQEQGRPPTALAGHHIAAVGEATAKRLSDLGVEPDIVPHDFRAEGLVDALLEEGAGPGWRILVPRAEKAREILPDTLRSLGVDVDVVSVYRTVPATPDPDIIDRLRAGEVDVVTFTSPSTARHFIVWVEESGLDSSAVMERIAAASIGPVTTEALVARGYNVPIEAERSTVGRLVDAIAEYVQTPEQDA